METNREGEAPPSQRLRTRYWPVGHRAGRTREAAAGGEGCLQKLQPAWEEHSPRGTLDACFSTVPSDLAGISQGPTQSGVRGQGSWLVFPELRAE